MSLSRRKFVQTGTALAAIGTTMPGSLLSSVRERQSEISDIQDPAIKEIANVALEVARSSGASYADARMEHNYECNELAASSKAESMTIGVRVLVDGYWGFASSPVWSNEEAKRLANEAVRNARANNIGNSRRTELAPVMESVDQLQGHWVTPIVDDPFLLSFDEMEDYFRGVTSAMNRLPDITLNAKADFFKRDKLFVSTVGHSQTQRQYLSSGDFKMKVKHHGREVEVVLDTTTLASAGFEYIRGQNIREQLLKLIEEAKEEMSLPMAPVEIGRHEVVIDANSVAGLVCDTIGLATELDRALGFEANASGTSYIVDPLEMIGSFKIGSPELTITANRSEPMGAATVKWDDEGTMPKEFTLVNKGVLEDMQTDRESAMVLRSAYEKQNKPMQSYGCSFAPRADQSQLTHAANLKVVPGKDGNTFESLIAGVEKGVVFKGAMIDIDHQQISGMISGKAFEVRHGKRVAQLMGAGMIFRTPELWGALSSTGDKSSQKRIGMRYFKGEPKRMSALSVTSVPIALKEGSVVDITRKA